MFYILTGIGELKKVNSLPKARAGSSTSAIEKRGKSSDLGKIKFTQKTKSEFVQNGSIRRSIGNVTTAEIRSAGNIFIIGDKGKKIRNLVHKRLLCEGAIRLKQEIKNFSSVIFYHLC